MGAAPTLSVSLAVISVSPGRWTRVASTWLLSSPSSLLPPSDSWLPCGCLIPETDPSRPGEGFRLGAWCVRLGSLVAPGPPGQGLGLLSAAFSTADGVCLLLWQTAGSFLYLDSCVVRCVRTQSWGVTRSNLRVPGDRSFLFQSWGAVLEAAGWAMGHSPLEGLECSGWQRSPRAWSCGLALQQDPPWAIRVWINLFHSIKNARPQSTSHILHAE